MCITSMCYLPGLSALVRWKRLDGSRGLKQLSNGQLRGVVRVCVCRKQLDVHDETALCKGRCDRLVLLSFVRLLEALLSAEGLNCE